MNNLRKEKALRDYAEQIVALGDAEEAAKFLAGTGNNYKAEDIVEIIEAAMSGARPSQEIPKENPVEENKPEEKPEENKPESKPEENKPEDKPEVERFTKEGGLMKFTEFKMKARKKDIVIPGKGKETIIEAYVKDGPAIRDTHMEQKHADILNSQMLNTKRYFFGPNDPEEVDPLIFY